MRELLEKSSMTQEPITCAETAPKTSPENGQPQDPPDYLWIVTDETGNPSFETMEGRQYMRLYETPEEAETAPRMPGRALLCHVIVRRLKAANAVYRKDNGSWLWEKITMDPGSVRVEYQYRLYGSCTRRETEYLDPLKPDTPSGTVRPQAWSRFPCVWRPARTIRTRSTEP